MNASSRQTASVIIASLMAVAALALHSSAYAINAKYAQQLERSGCTQLSEAQGCDIRKSKAENAKAGFVIISNNSGAASDAAPQTAAPSAATPYAGQWVAKSDSGATVATIRIDAKERVWVNGKPVKAKRSDGGLVFKSGTITFRIQGDRRLKGEDSWTDSDAGTKGLIQAG
ncbi:hypothetical protein [Paucibacter sp. XJ19-41]|uniref:hypothetical protein n=1 Tax=Paucibacter sp. XJ19-41 TaxID=2927824 RepID=UPI00234B7FD5|nr:hypothetical protein [Paucibacter sp. XJ19-41]MDC6169921.1 hypothetical protein [Paucibacter sp. XJ19-41]